MNLSEIRQRLSDLYGNTFASTDEYYDRIINDAYKKLCSYADWWWLRGNTYFDVFPTTTLDDTEQITATNGSTDLTVTTTSDLSSGLAGGSLYANEELYEISSVSQTGTNDYTITLCDAWRDSSSSYDATVWNPYKQMPTDTMYVLSVHPVSESEKPPLQLVTMSWVNSFDIQKKTSARETAKAAATKIDNTGRQWVRIWPPGSTEATYRIYYRKQAEELSMTSSTAGEPLIPKQYHPVLVDAAKVELLKNEGEEADRIQAFELELQKGVRGMLREQSVRGPVNRRFGRWGKYDSGKIAEYSLQNASPYTTY